MVIRKEDTFKAMFFEFATQFRRFLARKIQLYSNQISRITDNFQDGGSKLEVVTLCTIVRRR